MIVHVITSMNTHQTDTRRVTPVIMWYVLRVF